MKKKNPHAVALGRLGGLNSGGHREGAGRPRKTDVPRCACGAMTLAHALAVRHKCDASRHSGGAQTLVRRHVPEGVPPVWQFAGSMDTVAGRRN